MHSTTANAVATPNVHPSSAQDTAQPDSELALVSDNPRGVMKLASIAETAPEMTAVS